MLVPFKYQASTPGAQDGRYSSKMNVFQTYRAEFKQLTIFFSNSIKHDRLVFG